MPLVERARRDALGIAGGRRRREHWPGLKGFELCGCISRSPLCPRTPSHRASEFRSFPATDDRVVTTVSAKVVADGEWTGG